MATKSAWRAAAVVVWAAVCVGALGGLWAYSVRPGEAAEAPARLPPSSAVERRAGLATLVVLAHPCCSCTRATLDELGWVLARAQGRVAASIVFVEPAGLAWDPKASATWREARAIPGARVLRDPGGREAALFGSRTSGQVLLYDAGGRLAFSGGITSARGHEGDNPGRRAVLALLDGREALASTPVFGCAFASRGTGTRRPWLL